MQTTIALPEGWFLGGSHAAAYEAGVALETLDEKPAAYLRAREASGGFGTIMQQFKADAFRGRRLRLSARVRSENVDRWAGLWMRIDGAARRLLAFDNMHRRGITGTTDWTSYSVVLDVPEQESEQIAFGILLSGTGQVWMADVQLDAVGQDVPTTASTRLRDRPINLDFAPARAG